MRNNLKRGTAVAALCCALTVGAPATAQADEGGGNCGRSATAAGLAAVSFLGGTALLWATPLTGGASTVGAIALYQVSAGSLPLALGDASDNC